MRHATTARRRRNGTWLRIAAAVVVGLSLLLLSSGRAADGASGAAACVPAQPKTCTLRQLADQLGIRIGATITSSRLADAAYADLLAKEFNAATPDNELKWYSVQPAPGDWRFTGGDLDLTFGTDHQMAIKGHNLIWAQDRYTPSWVRDLSASDLRDAVAEHIATVVGRYAGRIPRWDVVNEPLKDFGTGPSDSVFHRKLSKRWITKVFELAHQADPDAELWLNEYGTDWVPGKFDALLALVKRLQAQGAPIDGVGLEMHRPLASGPDVGQLVQQMRSIAKLGLKVGLTELDVPIKPGDASGPAAQAKAYGRMVGACLQVSRCREVTMWGIDDGHSWLDNLGIFPTPTRPLLFDEQLAPKPAYNAVRACLARAVLVAQKAKGPLPACAGA